MKNYYLLRLLVVGFCTFLISCGGDDEPVVDCSAAGLNFSSVESDASCGSDDGSITISASGGNSSYMYKLGTGSFGSSNKFEGLSSGDHVVTVKDGNDCETSKTVSVLAETPSFANSVKEIIDTDCAISGCHVAGGQRSDLTNLATIQSNAAGIKSRTQSGNMPQGGRTLTAAEKDLIACWVDGGALDN